jgi:hypothetical protein
MSKVAQFIQQYPGTDGYILICVAEAAARQQGISRDSIIAAALTDRFAALRLLAATKRLTTR